MRLTIGSHLHHAGKARFAAMSRRELLKQGGILALGSVLATGCMTGARAQRDTPPLSAPFPKPDFVVKPRPSSSAIAWTPNVKVLAAVGQDYYAECNTDKPHCYGLYTRALVSTLRRPEVRGLEAAHTVLEATGYYRETPEKKEEFPFGPYQKAFPSPKPKSPSGYSLIYPTSTNRRLEAWQKDEVKTRYAILLGGRDGENHTRPKDLKKGFNLACRQDLDAMQQALIEVFGLTIDKDKAKTQIIRVDNAGKHDVEHALDWAKARLKPGDELLLFYTGHGDGSLPKATDKEGDASGIISGPNVSEVELKKWVSEKLGSALTDKDNPAKLLIVLDDCLSGAMTASATPAAEHYSQPGIQRRWIA